MNLKKVITTTILAQLLVENIDTEDELKSKGEEFVGECDKLLETFIAKCDEPMQKQLWGLINQVEEQMNTMLEEINA